MISGHIIFRQYLLANAREALVRKSGMFQHTNEKGETRMIANVWAQAGEDGEHYHVYGPVLAAWSESNRKAALVDAGVSEKQQKQDYCHRRLARRRK